MSKRPSRRYSPEEKAKILRLHLLEQVPISETCKEQGIFPTMFYQWQKALFDLRTRSQTRHRPQVSKVRPVGARRTQVNQSPTRAKVDPPILLFCRSPATPPSIHIRLQGERVLRRRQGPAPAPLVRGDPHSGGPRHVSPALQVFDQRLR
jgi:transposase